MRRTPRIISAAVLISAGTLLPAPAGATTPSVFVVDSADDLGDVNVGDGVCNAGTGHCTLRAAIMETEAGESSVITIDVTTRIRLRRPGTGEDDGRLGDLDVHGDVSIRGLNLLGGRSGSGRNDRLFDVHPGASLSLSDSRLREGLPEIGASGGAIRSRGHLSLHDVSIEDNRARAGDGGGVHAAAGSTLLLDGVDFLANEADGDGGGLSAASAEILAHDATYVQNRAGRNGGGAAIDGGGGRVEAAGIWTENRAHGDGGGIHLVDLGADSRLSGVASGNEAGGNGGGVAVPNASGLAIVDVDVRTSSAQRGGGLWLVGPDGTRVEGRISNNRAYVAGGGTWTSGGAVTIASDTYENVADGPAPADGGGVHAQDTDLTLLGTVARNRSSGSGGGIRSVGGRLTAAEFAEIKSNDAGGDGAGISMLDGESLELTNVRVEINHADGNGGNVYLDGTAPTTATITDSQIWTGVAVSGGGIWAGPAVSLEVHSSELYSNFARGTAPGEGGGGLFVDGASVLVARSVVRQNHSRSAGGGVLLRDGHLRTFGTRYNGSTAVTEGGGLAMYDGELDSRGAVRYTFNHVEGPGSRGGGLFIGGGSAVIENGSLRRNSAVEAGGGVLCGAAAVVAIDHVTPRENAAALGPNVFNEGGTCSLKGAAVAPGTGL